MSESEGESNELTNGKAKTNEIQSASDIPPSTSGSQSTDQAASSSALVAQRGVRKGVVTRGLRDLRRYMAEEDTDQVVRKLELLKKNFSDFTCAHDAYCDTCADQKDVEANDAYYSDIEDEYIEAVKGAREWLRWMNVAPARSSSRSAPEEDRPAPVADAAVRINASNVSDGSLLSSSSDALRQDIISMITLPKVELEPYAGEPLKFHSFFAAFDENVHDVVTDGKMRLSRLLQYTTGKAKDAIRSCSLIGGEAGYLQARQILATRFGDDYIVSEHIAKDLKSGKPVRSPAELRQFADELLSGHATLEKMGQLQQVDNQSCIISIADRLQPYIRNRWKRHAVETKRESSVYPKFKDFVNFISKQADEATDPVYGSWNAHKNPSKPTASDGKKSSTSFTTSTQPSQHKRRSCVLCGEDHRLFWCARFKAMKPTERLQIVVNHKLCENCLLHNHVANDCRKPSVCSVEGCGLKHTKFIHIDNRSNPKTPQTSETSQAQATARVNRADVDRSGGTGVCIPIVPVVVNDQFNTYALLDTGSNTTFCTRAMVKSLAVQGYNMTYKLSTLGTSSEVKNTEVVNLCVKSKNGKEKIELRNVYVVDDIPVENPIVDVAQFPHLVGLPIVVQGQVNLLIGQDHAEALIPLEVKKGRVGDPFAVRTLFGWSMNGPLASPDNNVSNKRAISNFVSADLSHNLWSVEDEHVSSDKIGMSVEDVKVLEMWNEEVELVNGHYQIPIPLRECKIPNNLSVAQSRLESIKRTVDRKGWFPLYNDEIQKLLVKDYAERVPVKLYDVNDKVWYLPHHAVTSVNKPGKIRVVFDCSAKYLGQSLNDVCMSGPDLINNLQHVLLRFRNHRYAISADVEAMYYQVVVPECQRDCLRFLWYDCDGNVQHYRMCVHVFGGIWSGSAAGYALRRCVEDFEASELVREVVRNSFYVDDCLLSVGSVDEAVEVIQGVKEVLKCGGFNLTKFVVNNEILLSEIAEVDRAVQIKDLSADASSKVLGVHWHVKSDTLRFHVKLQEVAQITRRSMLSMVSSLYDPLGLIAPVLVVGRRLFQDVTRLNLGWDEPVPLQVSEAWIRWLESLESLADIVIPRCIVPDGFQDAYMELHHFSDASCTAYGCCSYLRCVNKSGQVCTSLVYGKGRVAPIKGLSIPRLELQAAVVAVRVDSMLREQLKLDLGPSIFWVDSKVVLGYIYNETRRFHVYVANRVSEIHRLSDSCQWKHVPGETNPADIVSRGAESLMSSSWYAGPQFLRTHKDSWVAPDESVEVDEDDPEVRKAMVSSKVSKVVSHNVEVHSEIHPLDKLIDYPSEWYSLKRAVSWLLRVKGQLRGEVVAKGPLTVAELQVAEVVILKHVQDQWFAAEIQSLSAGKVVSKSSRIRDLLPVLGDDKLLRVGGRVKNASITFDRKHPIILPHKCRVALLVAREAHCVAHVGVEWSLSRLRSKFWVTQGRSLLRKVKADCITCRKMYAPTCTQKMADLPAERVAPGYAPFSMVGTDCFGPVMVKYGRSQAKRFVCLFTCFATRSVHLEVLHSMDTDSVINALRRFIARRGTPLKIWSDQGTNYVGCKNELARSVKQINNSRFYEFCNRQNIEWVFNPPYAPHMGGVFERMVQTVKRVLNAVVDNARLTDETLCTFLCETENMVNSRPITKVSSDASDQAALTPNHLLLLQGASSPLPGEFCVADVYRRRWRQVQHLADVFWSRWIKEYVPQLQKATKWHEAQRNLKVNDLVLVADEHTPRGLWPMGIVTHIKLSNDGYVRSVHVKTKASTFVRPITKIVLLEGN